MTTNPHRPRLRAVRSALAPLFALLFLTALAPPAGALTPEDVPSPLPGGWVADLAGVLPPATIDALNREADRVHAEGRGELAVAVVRATDDGDSLGFALRLFDHWGVGDSERNDGVLLFLSVEDRAAEIVLGAGVDDPGRQAASDRIMQTVMVPRFRQGDLGGGLADGARAVAGDILGAPYSVPTGAAAETEPPVRRPVPIRTELPSAARRSGGGWGGLLLLAIVVAIALLVIVRLSRDRPPAGRGGGGSAPASGPGFFTRVFQGYKECPRCGAWERTRRRRVIDHATTYSEGLAEIRYFCPDCLDEEVQREVIPRDRPPSRSYGGGSSSSSSSSSRPSSFGGGRSRGGGSSGRW